jgi:tetratricopeptide (TPR) repeat protein
MARDPEARYASPDALAEDLERWLADEPVNALREPLVARARRWARRHRTLASTAATVLVLGTAGLALALSASQRNAAQLARANDLAEARLDLAMQAVEDYHTGVGGEVLLGQTEFAGLRKRLLEKPAEFYGRLADEPSLRTADSPRARALLGRAQLGLAEILGQLGELERADDAYRKAVDAFSGVVSDPSTAADAAAAALDELAASCGLAELRRRRDRPEDALAIARQVLDRLLAVRPGLQGDRQTTAKLVRLEQIAWNLVGLTSEKLGRLDDAVSAFEHALAIPTSLIDPAPGGMSPVVRRGLVANNLCVRYAQRGDVARTLGIYDEVIRAMEEHLARNPNDLSARNLLGDTYDNLGYALTAFGRADEGIAPLRRAVELQERAVGLQPNVREYREDLAGAYLNLSHAMQSSRHPREVAEVAEEAIRRFRDLIVRYPDSQENAASLALLLSNQSALLWRMKDYRAAADHAIEAISRLTRLVELSPDRADFRDLLADTRGNLGLALGGLGRNDEAAEAFRQSIVDGEQIVTRWPDILEYRHDLAWSHGNYGEFLVTIGRSKEAERSCGRAIAIMESLRQRAPDNLEYLGELAELRYYLGLAQKALGRTELAEDSLARSLEEDREVLQKQPGRAHQSDWAAKHASELVGVRLVLGKAAEAISAAREGRRLAGDNPDALYNAARGLALCAESKRGEPQRMGELADEAMRVLRQAVQAGFREGARALLDKDLAPLRDRADFQMLILDMAFPPDPFLPGP